PDVDADELVASARAAAEFGDAAAAHPQHAAALDAGVDLEARAALQRGHLHLRTEGGIREGEVEVVVDVEPVAGEVLVRLLLDLDAEVAGRAAALAGVAAAADLEVVALGHARRDLHRDRLLALDAALARAVRARRRDDAALAVARRARLDVDELAEERVGDLPDLAGAGAGRARLEALGAALGAAAAADAADDELADLELTRDALGDLFEREREAHAEVGARPALAASAARPAEHVLEAARGGAAEDVRERR